MNREDRERVHRAIESASHCLECGKELGPQEPVWRSRSYRWRRVVACCKECRTSRTGWFEDPKPCEACGRIVHNEPTMRDRVVTFCCSQCAKSAYVTRTRKLRADARPRSETSSCILCHKPFEPKRSDAQFCSNACRQKAYRQGKPRVTDVCENVGALSPSVTLHFRPRTAGVEGRDSRAG
jgi:hypothetical protein